uniref:Uncharacterized protein n=1 Tax=Arundo donax TaxID=35708 RepID=A0A0A9C0D6_ARUDO
MWIMTYYLCFFYLSLEDPKKRHNYRLPPHVDCSVCYTFQYEIILSIGHTEWLGRQTSLMSTPLLEDRGNNNNNNKAFSPKQVGVG